MNRWFRLLLPPLILLFLAACSSGTSTGPGQNGPNPPAVVLQDEVEVLDEDLRSNLSSFSLDAAGEGELRFQTGDPALDALQQGTVLASEPVPGIAPHGFLQKVVSKKTEGGEVIVVTEQATLLETFEQAQIRFQQELDPSHVTAAEANYQGVSFSDASSAMRPLASTGFAFTVNFDEVLVDADDDESTTDDQLRIDGNFNFDATASASIDIDCCENLIVPYLDLFESKIELNESVDVSITGELAAGFDERFEVARYDFGTFTVMVGPVPVVFVIEMVVSVGANGHFEARLEAGAVQSTSVTVGARYTDDSGWEDLTSFDSNFDFPTPQITAAASARAFLRPQLNIEIYGLAGPYAYAEAFVAADAEMYRDPFWRFSAGVDFGIGFVIDLPVVGTLAEWDTTIAGFEETLEESGNGAPTIELDLPTVVESGDTIDLEASAVDREDGPFCCTFSWSSDVDGYLGSENGLEHVLSTTGAHQITLTITDSDGASTSETVTVYAASITIDQPGPSFRFGDGLPLRATLDGFPPGSSPRIAWSYLDSDSGEVSIYGSTSSGELKRYFDVECARGLQVFAKVTVSGAQAIEERTATECIPKFETHHFAAIHSLGGEVSNDGTVEVGAEYLRVGDDASNTAWRGYLHFDVSRLPDDADMVGVESATLTLNPYGIDGQPFANLVKLNIVHVDYGGILDADDFDTFTSFPTFISRDDSFGTAPTDFDVGTVFEDAFEYDASNLEQVQFVLYFNEPTDNDGTSDLLNVSYRDDPTTDLLPTLKVRVQNY